jgi:hypothetical protein
LDATLVRELIWRKTHDGVFDLASGGGAAVELSQEERTGAAENILIISIFNRTEWLWQYRSEYTGARSV